MELLNRFELSLVVAVENGTWEANLILFCAIEIDKAIDTIDHAHMKHSKMGNALTNI